MSKTLKAFHRIQLGISLGYIRETDLDIVENELKNNEILKSHIVEIDNNQDNGDDYYFIAFEKTKEVRELLEKLKEVLCKD